MSNDTANLFPADKALSAMGDKSRRWQNHLETGRIYAPPDVSLVSSDGPGRGKMRRFSIEAIVQGAIAFALIDAGVKVREAYRAGAKFAYLGEFGDPLWRDENAPLDPVLDRLAGRLYAEGETYLIYAVGEIEPHEDRFVIISDANPAFDVSTGQSAPEAVRYAVGGNDASPCILLNISEVCAKIAAALGIPFAAAFLTEVG